MPSHNGRMAVNVADIAAGSRYKSNIILIGMPGAGKSTIGPALAERLGKRFMDTDDVVAEIADMELKTYAAQYGKESFLRLQENSILCLQLSEYVLATGGSVGCSSILMDYLKREGYAVYLKLDYSVVAQRLAPGRTLARDGGETLEELYAKREPVYRAYADIIVECTGKSAESIVNEILNSLELIEKSK